MITLLSDFGVTDPYVAQMKGVIRSINPRVEIVDISHLVEKHNILMGSFILETSVPFFPTGTVHVAVVDPGVGGSRLPIVIMCDRGLLIGPDNGLLARASDRLGFLDAFRISNQKLIKENLSTTFHGRDIFANVAAEIAQGSKPNKVGPRVSKIVRLDIPRPNLNANQVTCAVLYVDSFGNIVTNVSDQLSKRSRFGRGKGFSLKVRNRSYAGLIVKSYSELSHRQVGLLRGSQGYLEIAIREGNAAKRLGVSPLDQLKIRFM